MPVTGPGPLRELITDPAPPTVSIVTPVHNAAQFLEPMLNSVRAQTYAGWEHILVDDASTDDSLSILLRAAELDARIRIHRLSTPSHGRPGVARNAAIARARGRYVAFLDADDYWTPSALERLVREMDIHSDAVMAYGVYQILFPDGTVSGVLPKPANRFQGRVVHQLLLKPSIANSAVIVQHDVLQQVGPQSEEFGLGEDFDLWIRIAQRGPLRCVEGEPLLIYRQVAASHSSGVFMAWRRTIRLLFKHGKLLSPGRMAWAFTVASLSAMRRLLWPMDRHSRRSAV